LLDNALQFFTLKLNLLSYKPQKFSEIIREMRELTRKSQSLFCTPEHCDTMHAVTLLLFDLQSHNQFFTTAAA